MQWNGLIRHGRKIFLMECLSAQLLTLFYPERCILPQSLSFSSTHQPANTLPSNPRPRKSPIQCCVFYLAIFSIFIVLKMTKQILSHDPRDRETKSSLTRESTPSPIATTTREKRISKFCLTIPGIARQNLLRLGRARPTQLQPQREKSDKANSASRSLGLWDKIFFDTDGHTQPGHTRCDEIKLVIPDMTF